MNVDHQERAAKKGQLKRNIYKRSKKECVKVVYISSPMKVKTSASEFRSLVQHLTGKHSDISQYTCSRGDDFHDMVDYSASCCKETTSDGFDQKSLSISPNDTPTSSVDYSSLGGHMSDNVFGAIFSSDSFYDPSQMDVLGSFDDLL